MKAAELMTKSEYARHRGCAPSAVTRAIKEGRISLIGDKINPRLADLEWAENSRARADSGAAVARTTSGGTQAPSAAASAPAQADLTQPGPEGEGGTAPVNPAEASYAENRRRREAAEAERAELETARAAGRLVDKERLERAVFEAFRTLRDSTFAACKSQARRVLGLTEVRDIEIALEDELREAFGGWEERMRRRIAEASES